MPCTIYGGFDLPVYLSYLPTYATHFLIGVLSFSRDCFFQGFIQGYGLVPMFFIYSSTPRITTIQTSNHSLMLLPAASVQTDISASYLHLPV